MKLLRSFTLINRKGLSGKLLLYFGSLFLLVLLLLGIIVYFSTERYINNMFKQEMNKVNSLVYEMTKMYVNNTIKNHLVTVAKKNRDLIAFYYQRYKSGRMSYKDAYSNVRQILLDPEYGKIGQTGYLAGVSSKGILKIHPKSEGVDASGHSFMQQAIKLKNGYIEYKWKNVGETEEREKVGALAYFEPWDIIIWASSYKTEFSDIIEMTDLKRTILSIKLGKTGYPYVIDTTGKLIIHPEIGRAHV